jgi:hypothetical protein
VKRSEGDDAIAGRSLREARAELDELVGEGGLRVEWSEIGAVADELRVDGGEREGRQLEELLERDEDRELGGGEQLIRGW